MSEPTAPKPSTSDCLPDLVASEHLPYLNEALAALFGGVREASELFEASAAGQREGMIHAVETVLKFLTRFDCVQRERLQAPLANLLTDLMQLDEGDVSSALRPNKRSGRHRASAISDSIKGAAVFTVERLVLTGLSLDEAADLVARELRRAGVSAERGRFPNLTGRTLRTWRESVRADIKSEGEAAQTRDLLEAKEPVPVAAELSASRLHAVRNEYLSRLTSTSARILGQKPT